MSNTVTIYSSDTAVEGGVKYLDICGYGSIPVQKIHLKQNLSWGDAIESPGVGQFAKTKVAVKLPILAYVNMPEYVNGKLINGTIDMAFPLMRGYGTPMKDLKDPWKHSELYGDNKIYLIIASRNHIGIGLDAYYHADDPLDASPAIFFLDDNGAPILTMTGSLSQSDMDSLQSSTSRSGLERACYLDDPLAYYYIDNLDGIAGFSPYVWYNLLTTPFQSYTEDGSVTQFGRPSSGRFGYFEIVRDTRYPLPPAGRTAYLLKDQQPSFLKNFGSLADAPSSGGDADPVDPEKPSGDDDKGTKPNDHISIPDGDYNYDGDEIKDDGAPDDNPNSTGIMGLWAPTKAQYKDFCHYLWNGFQQAMVGAFGNNDGMQCILACKEYPFVINATKEATMALGKVDTHLTINVAPGNYFAIVYKGTVKNPSHSFMDYSPYSKLSVYLPYIGITDLDIDQVSGRKVTITYKIDIVSGIGVVLISTVDDNKKNIVIGSYPVQMGKELPVTATDYQRLAQSWAGLAMTAVGASLGVGLPLMAGVMPIVGTALTASNSGTALGMAMGAGGAVAGSAGQAASSTKADIKQSGTLGGCSGMLGISYPYFIYKMTNFSNSGYKSLIGKKSSAVVKLSTLKGSGFNKIEAVNLHIEGATDEELAEIKQDLVSGVIL